MKFSFFKTRLFAPLYASMALLLLLLLGQEALSFIVEIRQKKAIEQISNRFEAKRESENLLEIIIQKKAILESYLLNSTNLSLENYRQKENEFQNSLDRLSLLLQDNPTQLKQLDNIQNFYHRWHNQSIQPILDGSFNVSELPKPSSLNTLQTYVENLIEQENKLLSNSSIHLDKLAQLNRFNSSLSLFNIVFMLVGAGINLWLLRQRVELPLKHLTKVSHTWRKGKLQARLQYSSQDEIGQLAKALNLMASNINTHQQLIQNRTQQLEDLIRTLSHDLRTPLLANRNTLDAILGGAFGSVDDLLKELLKEYRQANEDLIELVEDLLDVSRYEAKGNQIINREPLDWSKILTRVTTWNESVTKKKCELVCNIAPSLPTVYGDPIEIQRVLQNLVDNAVRLSEPGQKVDLGVNAFGDKEIRIYVQDRGPGIAPQETELLFYRFVQGLGRKGKAGLGLYLCRQIVEAHGGTIQVDSVLGEGSTFWFTLPREKLEK